MNIKSQQIVSEDDIKKSGGLIYDVADETPTSLPNASNILDNIILILEYINTPDMLLLRETDKTAFELTIEEKFPEFALSYYSVLKMIMSGADIQPLFKMLEIINTVNTGKKSIADSEKDVSKYLSKFLPEGLLEKLESGELTANDIKTKKPKKSKF